MKEVKCLKIVRKWLFRFE